MSGRDLGERMAALLQDEIRCTAELFGVLEHEEAALRARDLEAIDVLGKRKRALVEQLEQAEARRTHLLEREIAPRGGDWMQKPLFAHLRAARDRLAALLVQVKRQNRINGVIIDATHRHVQRAMDVLMNQRSRERLYDSLGASRRLTTHRFSSSV